MDTYKEAIDECPDDTSPDMMEDCVNNNLDDTNKKGLNEINDIGNGEDEEKKPKTLKMMV